VSRARRIAWGLLAALVLTVPIAVLTAWAASSPGEHVRLTIDQVLRVLENHELGAGARHEQMRRLAAGIFDYPEMTKRALGPHWAARTPAEREEVTRLFRDLLERSYLSKIELYSGEKIAFTGESVEGDLATVRTRITTKQGAEVPVDYRMRRRDGRWLAYDVMIEGVSLVANYRGQFNKIIQAGSYAELARRLRAKVDERADGADAKVRHTSQPR
jgi:phospholipid transport system substrate-binding protein